jgi:hypothetical protein
VDAGEGGGTVSCGVPAVEYEAASDSFDDGAPGVTYELRYIGTYSPGIVRCTICGAVIAPVDPYLRVEVVPEGKYAPLLAGRACTPTCAKRVAERVPAALSRLSAGFGTYPPNGGHLGVTAC